MLVGVSFTAGMLMFVTARYGLLGVVTFAYFGWVVSSIPVILDQSSYLFTQSIVTMLITLGIPAAAFLVAVGGKSAIDPAYLIGLDEH